jgi:hypothetical protein
LTLLDFATCSLPEPDMFLVYLIKIQIYISRGPIFQRFVKPAMVMLSDKLHDLLIHFPGQRFVLQPDHVFPGSVLPGDLAQGLGIAEFNLNQKRRNIS